MDLFGSGLELAIGLSNNDVLCCDMIVAHHNTSQHITSQHNTSQHNTT